VTVTPLTDDETIRRPITLWSCEVLGDDTEEDMIHVASKALGRLDPEVRARVVVYLYDRFTVAVPS
jgi:hypothetical protein